LEPFRRINSREKGLEPFPKKKFLVGNLREDESLGKKGMTI
jgi:hypothetical protein